MSGLIEPLVRPAPPPRRPEAAVGALGAAGVGALAALAPGIDLSPLAQAPAALLIHMGAALAALALGAVLLIGRKGRRMHRVLGWTWVTAMGTAAASSLLIRGLNGDAFSWIHLLSAWTLVALPLGVVYARRHNVRRHSRTMIGLYVGGLLIAGAFTFLPGRLMWRIFFG